MNTLGHRIRQKRQEKRLSQDKLAELMDKSGKQIVSNWETDRSEPSISDLRKLAEVLDTTASWLIDGSESQINAVNELPPGYIVKTVEEELKIQKQLVEAQETILEYQKQKLAAQAKLIEKKEA